MARQRRAPPALPRRRRRPRRPPRRSCGRSSSPTSAATRTTQRSTGTRRRRPCRRFAALVREVVESRQGFLLELRGDEALAVFTSARQALKAANEIQRRQEIDALPRGIGIGLDAGEAIPIEGGFRGSASTWRHGCVLRPAPARSSHRRRSSTSPHASTDWRTSTRERSHQGPRRPGPSRNGRPRGSRAEAPPRRPRKAAARAARTARARRARLGGGRRHGRPRRFEPSHGRRHDDARAIERGRAVAVVPAPTIACRECRRDRHRGSAGRRIPRSDRRCGDGSTRRLRRACARSIDGKGRSGSWTRRHAPSIG